MFVDRRICCLWIERKRLGERKKNDVFCFVVAFPFWVVKATENRSCDLDFNSISSLSRLIAVDISTELKK